jgi:hypothetical protein
VGPRAGLDGCGKSRPHRDSIPDLPARSDALYRLSYPGPSVKIIMSTYISRLCGQTLQSLLLNQPVLDKTNNRIRVFSTRDMSRYVSLQ